MTCISVKQVLKHVILLITAIISTLLQKKEDKNVLKNYRIGAIRIIVVITYHIVYNFSKITSRRLTKTLNKLLNY